MTVFSFNRTPSQWRIDDVSKLADLCFPLDIHHPDVWTFTALFFLRPVAVFSFDRTPSQWRIDDVSKLADLCFPLDIHHPDVWTFTALFF